MIKILTRKSTDIDLTEVEVKIFQIAICMRILFYPVKLWELDEWYFSFRHQGWLLTVVCPSFELGIFTHGKHN